MGYLSCNAESAIATCDPDCSKKLRIRTQKHFKIRDFSYLDLQSATNGFSADCFLGKGSHGSVYKAVLDGGKLIAAVKRITAPPVPPGFNNPYYGNNNNNNNNSTTSPADNEIEILSKIRNPRLVNLLGFAVDSSERKLIVVEYMPNGTLFDSLHGSTKPPGWARRVRFALQVASAVQHLHSSNPPVIHRDIKSSNVLIDGNWNARLGDFGLALRGHVEDVKVKCTPPAGTLGYLDPGYLAPGDLSAKSDVFSFGILLLEMITGRNAIDVNYSPPSVVDWAIPMIKTGDYAGICDPRIGRPVDVAVVRQLSVLVAKCVRSTAAKRPAMSDVVDCLKVVNRRVTSPAIWNSLGRRLAKPPATTTTKYEQLEDISDTIKTSSRNGSRRNRKVSSVSSGVELTTTDRMPRSKSIGSVVEIKPQPSDLNLRRRGGLAVKMTTVRLRKSRSMGMLQSTARLGQSNGPALEMVRNPNNVGEMEESKLLINLGKSKSKRAPEKDE